MLIPFFAKLGLRFSELHLVNTMLVISVFFYMLYLYPSVQNNVASGCYDVGLFVWLQLISAISGGITDLSFDAVGYAWQILNCFCTSAYSVSCILLLQKFEFYGFSSGLIGYLWSNSCT